MGIMDNNKSEYFVVEVSDSPRDFIRNIACNIPQEFVIYDNNELAEFIKYMIVKQNKVVMVHGADYESY